MPPADQRPSSAASTWEIVLWHTLRGSPHGKVCAEYDTREEADDALAWYVKTYGGADKVGVREHLAPLSLDAYVDRGGR